MVLLDVGTRGKEKSPHYTYPVEMLSATIPCVYRVFRRIARILIEYTDSNVPWLDSFTTALSIVGMWMLARKYIEQWFAWILVDIVCCGLYIYKDLYFTSALYGLYSIIAIFGYFKWKKIMNMQ